MKNKHARKNVHTSRLNANGSNVAPSSMSGGQVSLICVSVVWCRAIEVNHGNLPITFKQFECLVKKLGSPDECVPDVDQELFGHCITPVDDNHDEVYGLPLFEALFDPAEKKGSQTFVGGETAALSRLKILESEASTIEIGTTLLHCMPRPKSGCCTVTNVPIFSLSVTKFHDSKNPYFVYGAQGSCGSWKSWNFTVTVTFSRSGKSLLILPLGKQNYMKNYPESLIVVTLNPGKSTKILISSTKLFSGAKHCRSVCSVGFFS